MKRRAVGKTPVLEPKTQLPCNSGFWMEPELCSDAILPVLQASLGLVGSCPKVLLRPRNPADSGGFFFCASAIGACLLVAAFELYLYTAVDSRPGPGGVEPRQAVSPKPGGQGRYRFATASAG